MNLRDYIKNFDKAYYNYVPLEEDFKDFINMCKDNYKKLMDAKINNETEENIKNTSSSEFIKEIYKGRKDIAINAYGKKDLCIKKDNYTRVIFEYKKPSNKSEMINEQDINKKALHEVIYYSLKEYSDSNYYVNYLIITDGLKFFIFDNKQFISDKDLVKICKEANFDKTEDIYNCIKGEIKDKSKIFNYGYFDLESYDIDSIDCRNIDFSKGNIKELIQVYKILHPNFLLKEFKHKDSNQLNRGFYNELLYILGLKEIKEANKYVIKLNDDENKKGLLHEIISRLRANDSVNSDNDAFNNGFELLITWLNRILFLKLFESQLISFNNDKNFIFLSSEKMNSWQKMDTLFFEILGKKIKKRDDRYKDYNYIPYLNSSLFERSEKETFYHISIFQLRDDTTTLLYDKSVLKKEIKYKNDKKPVNLLQYLLDFLDSYDFSSNSGNNKEIIKSKNEVINSAVLGLIFEKLNGYKDGSVYTPGFITEYMSKQVINNILIQKFNEKYKANIKEMRELANFTKKDCYAPDKLKEYNEIVNSLKILDPAVGSGHFPVSVLNQIIYTKSYLGILCDENYNIVNNSVEIIDDALVVYNNDDTVFHYQRDGNKENLKIQKTLFNEKRKIIENCLFGVDINQKSVYICQLRLWIELLKSAYYIDNSDEMETLPNIDINIKCGNSLISKYKVAIGTSALKGNTKVVKDYKEAITVYKHSNDKKDKQEINAKIDILKKGIYKIANSWLNKLSKDDKKIKQEITDLKNKKEASKNIDEIKTIQEKIMELQNKAVRINFDVDYTNEVYKNSLEWTIEFPEVLDKDGKFIGFDVVIGNPPYIKEYDNKSAFDGYRDISPYYMGKMDLWYGFACLGLDLVKENGFLCFIAQNNWTTSAGAEKLRNKIISEAKILKIYDFNSFKVFDSASIQTMIMMFEKNKKTDDYKFDYKRLKSILRPDVLNMLNGENSNNITGLNPIIKRKNYIDSLLTFSEHDKLLDKICYKKENLYETEATNGIHPHFDFVNNKIHSKNPNFIVGQGIFGLSSHEKSLLKLSPSEENIIKPYYTSKEFYKYYIDRHNKYWVIYTDSSFKDKRSMDIYPQIKAHLDKFQKIITSDNKPYGLHRAREEHFFKGEKIVSLRKCAGRPQFSYSNFDCYVSATFYVIQTKRWDMKFLTGLLNSDLIRFWLKNKGKMQGENYQIDKEPLMNIPLPIVDIKEQKPIIELVEKIIELKENDKNADILSYENEINKLVYKLYNLDSNEIKIIEDSIKDKK